MRFNDFYLLLFFMENKYDIQFNKRKELAFLNLCNMQNCHYYKNEICTHIDDTVNSKTGISSCPLKKGSVLRINFKG